jgi:hypothetical protein
MDPHPEPADPDLDPRQELTSFLQNCTPDWGFLSITYRFPCFSSFAGALKNLSVTYGNNLT